MSGIAVSCLNSNLTASPVCSFFSSKLLNKDGDFLSLFLQ